MVGSKNETDRILGRLKKKGLVRLSVSLALFVVLVLLLFLIRWPTNAKVGGLAADEFAGIGQWVSGIVTAFSVYIGISGIHDQLSYEHQTLLLREAQKVHIEVTPDKGPSWVLKNDSDYLIKIEEISLKRHDKVETLILSDERDGSLLYPGNFIYLGKVSILSDVGYDGDRPRIEKLKFELAGRIWFIRNGEVTQNAE
jgi:hypothetical protein